MRAFLKNNRQAPRKVRLIARAVIGKSVAVAVSELSVMPHKGARTIKKLIESAAANAKQHDVSITNEDLIVKNITVDKGSVYVRYMPRAFGRATPLRRENSHIRVTLELKNGKELVATAPEKKEEQKVEDKKKTVEKKEGKKEQKKDTKATDAKAEVDTKEDK